MKTICSSIQVLDLQDIERLHHATLEVLSRAGCRLPHKRVLDMMRQMYWPSDLFNQKSWDAWQAEGGRDVYAKAHARVQKIQEEGYPSQPLLSLSTIAELDALVQDAGAHPERFGTDRYVNSQGAAT